MMCVSVVLVLFSVSFNGLFFSNNDVVFVLRESGCQGICFIPDIATKTETSEKIRILKADISTLQSRFKALKQTKQKDIENAKKEKDQMLKEIRLERNKINAQLDEMEAELLQEVDMIFQTKLQHIESNLKEIDINIVLLQDNLQKISSVKHENTSERYVQINCTNEKTKLARNLLEKFDRSCETKRIRFDPYSQESDPRCNTIGKIINLQGIKVENCHGDFNVRGDDDKSICCIIQMCICENGSIAMTDYNNKRIKIWNESFKVKASVATKGIPFGICEINPSLLAVSLIDKRKIQFISQKEPMQLQQSFKVGDRCRGIAYNDGLIYVCCGGSKEQTEGEVGHLDVYTVSGALLTSFYGGIALPIDLTLLSSTMDIFVVDVKKGITIIDKNHNMKKINLKNKDLSYPRCICKISESRYCIAYYSGSVLLMSCDGKDQEELLVKKDGPENVNGMFFDSKMSKLAVSSHDSDVIKVYNLKIGDMSR